MMRCEQQDNSTTAALQSRCLVPEREYGEGDGRTEGRGCWAKELRRRQNDGKGCIGGAK